jgi:hypothetical protein
MSSENAGWQHTATISSQATGPGTIVQSNYRLPGNLGNFEVAVLEGEDLCCMSVTVQHFNGAARER